MRNFFVLIICEILLHAARTENATLDNSYLNIVGIDDYDDDFEQPPEVFSVSTSGLVKALELESMFLQNLSDYADELQEKADTLQSIIKSIERPSHETHQEREEYVSNPLNAFSLIRRLHEDWPKWQNYTKAKVGQEKLQAMENISKIFHPDDMEEALMGMFRIEKFYDLDASDIAKGLLLDKQYNIQLSTRDCLALADYHFKRGDYIRAANWYRIVLKRQPEMNAEIFNEELGSRIKEARLLYARSMLTHGMSVHDRKSSPSQLKATIDEVLNKSTESDIDDLLNQLLSLDDKEIASQMKLADFKAVSTDFELGCRGLFPKRTNLSCRYNFTTTPFLTLAPLKMEDISLDPYIVMFHDVLYDTEIDNLKAEAMPYLTTGFAGARKKNTSENWERISHVSWVMDPTPDLIRVNQRIKDMTGFDLQNMDALQLSNFGLGGAFKEHYDYYTDEVLEQTSIRLMGDRQTSVIFYASDVTQGGATLFTKSQVAVLPRKGSALIWFNLHDDASNDPRSLHAVCPVIVGARWTITKWIHQLPQMFIKPCARRHSQ